ncbi:MAG: UvrD-helicase domain-containing protein, partial [Gemmatimonadota bacterium]
MARLPDQEDRDRLATDLEASYLCLAGAGAGKTHELVGRMVAAVAEGVAPVEAMAAITFTRKAAGEMRGRFFLGLRQRAAASQGARGARLRAAVERIDQCFVGTIHAFCAVLLRQRSGAAGLGLEFTELEERDERALQRRAWDDFLRERLAAGDERLEALAAMGHPAEDFYGFFVRRCQFSELPLKETAGGRPDLEAAFARVEALLAEAAPRLPAAGELDPFGELVRQTQRLIAYGGTLGDGDRAGVLAQFASQAGSRVTQKAWPEAERDFARHLHRQVLPALRQELEPVLRQWRQAVYQTAAGLIDAAVEAYGRQRRAAGLVTFQDLLERTAALLRCDAEARRYYRGRYRLLFVDEFQDTDPLQAEILLYLAADQDPGPGGWQGLTPRPGSLFLVGDEKQSIYRFRRADVEIFRRVRDRLAAGGGQVARLTVSFRARPALCAWMNDAFAPLFAAGDPAAQAAYAPLVPARPERAAAPAVWALRHPARP